VEKRSFTTLAVQILLLSAIIFFGIVLVNALDRNRREMFLLRQAIERMPRNVNNLQAASAGVGQAPAAPMEVSPLAEYFDNTAAPGGVLRSAIASDVGTLNPVTGNEATASRIIGFCTATLGVRDYRQPEKFVPMIAESWQQSADGRKINIKLRKNVLWHDFIDPESKKHVPEQEVTAHDFVFYVEVIRNPQVNAMALRGYFEDLESIRAVSDHELELVWKNQYFRSLEMSLGLIPLPRHFYCPNQSKFDPEKFNYDHRRNDMIVGCGPYKLIEHTRDQRFVLKRFDNYFGNALGIGPAVETRVLEVVKADNTRFQMLLAGELDELGLSPEQWIKRTNGRPFSKAVLTAGKRDSEQPLQKGETLRKVKSPGNAYFYIGYNLRNELFADKRVRQALTMLCNRERILKEVYYGQGTIISGPFFHQSPYCDPAVKPWPFDIEKARELLKSAGWRDRDGDGILDKNGKKFVFTALQVSGNPIQEKILSIFKEDLARAGIDMKLAVLEWPIYINKLEKREFEVCSLGWSMPFESDPYQVWHSSQRSGTGSNHIGFANARGDELIEAIRRTLDVQERIKLCREFHRLLHEEQPYIFLVMPEALQVLSGRISNVECFPLGLNSEFFRIAQ